MAEKSTIEWTDATWNPTVGCRIVSPGCTNCYAMRETARIERMGGKAGAKYAGLTTPSKAGPVWNGTIRLAEEALDQPLRWRKPRRIFVNSMSDLFAEELPDEAIDQVFAVMALCPQHTFQVLTKRAERMRDYLSAAQGNIWDAIRRVPGARSNRVVMCAGKPVIQTAPDWPLPNVWLGVSVEDQQRADERIPHLLQTPAAVRFISAEPLLEPVNLRRLIVGREGKWTFGYDALTGRRLKWWPDPFDPSNDEGELHIAPLKEAGPRINWMIVGGESGPRARPMHPDWVRSLRDQCAAADVPFFFKQWGEWVPAELAPDAGDPCFAVTPDGRHIRQEHARGDEHLICRVGKKAAGALLDGREHSQFPRVDIMASA